MSMHVYGVPDTPVLVKGIAVYGSPDVPVHVKSGWVYDAAGVPKQFFTSGRIVSDEFDYADGSFLGQQANWIQGSGANTTFPISNGKCRGIYDTWYPPYYCFWNDGGVAFSNDQFAEIVFERVASGEGNIGPGVRMTGSQGYFIEAHNSYAVVRRWNDYAVLWEGNVSIPDGAVLRITVEGTDLYCEINDVEFFRTTSATLTGGSPGIATVSPSGANGPNALSWRGGDLVTEAEPPPAGTPGDPPDLTAMRVSGGVELSVYATPPVGKSIIRYEIEYSADGVSGWTSTPIPETLDMWGKRSRVPASLENTTPTKWVDPSGTLDGHAAYTTIQAAADAAVPGDVIVVNGTFHENIVILNSGTHEQPIIFRSFNYSAPAVVDGQMTLPLGWNESGYARGSSTLVNITANYVYWEAINVINSARANIMGGPSNNNGHFLQDNEVNEWWTGIRITRCVLQRSYERIAHFFNCDSAIVSGNWFLEGVLSQWTGPVSGWPGAISVCGKNYTFTDNIIAQAIGEGTHLAHHISAGGPDRHTQLDGAYFAGNVIFDTWSNPLYLTNVRNIIVEGNLIFHTGDIKFCKNRDDQPYQHPPDACSFGSESGDTSVGGYPPSDGFIGGYNIDFRNNVIVGGLVNLVFDYWLSCQYKDVKIRSNTIYSVQPMGVTGLGYEALIQNEPTNTENLTVRNNIFYEPAHAMYRNYNALIGTNLINSNWFNQTPPPALAAGAIIGTDPGLTNAAYLPYDPWPNLAMFDTSNFRLVDSSVCINAGVPDTDITVDWFNRPRPVDHMDLGAHSLSRPTNGSAIFSDLGRYWRARYVDSAQTASGWSDVADRGP
jgi:hypothetical protein